MAGSSGIRVGMVEPFQAISLLTIVGAGLSESIYRRVVSKLCMMLAMESASRDLMTWCLIDREDFGLPIMAKLARAIVIEPGFFMPKRMAVGSRK
jgi:hypothetical protein